MENNLLDKGVEELEKIFFEYGYPAAYNHAKSILATKDKEIKELVEALEWIAGKQIDGTRWDLIQKASAALSKHKGQ